VGRRLKGRSKCRWVDNIGMILGERGWISMDWIGLAQDKGKRRTLVNAAMNIWVP
jgi:hypothetical protein